MAMFPSQLPFFCFQSALKRLENIQEQIRFRGFCDDWRKSSVIQIC